MMVLALEGRQTLAHTFANLLTHVIFSTKGRQPLLTLDLRTDLLAYMGGIVRNLHGKLIDANARPDHVHCLLSPPPALAVAEALRVIKSNSSLWIHERWRRQPSLGRQGMAPLASVNPTYQRWNYIRNQEQHHRKISFREEFIALLKAHRIPYDERYIWE
jgi:putative transposase